MVFAKPHEMRFQPLRSMHGHWPLPRPRWAAVASVRSLQHVVMAVRLPTTSYTQSQSGLQQSMDCVQAHTRRCVPHCCRHLLCQLQRGFMGSRGHLVLLLVLLLLQLPVLLAVVTSDGTQQALPQPSHPSKVLAHRQGSILQVFP